MASDRAGGVLYEEREVHGETSAGRSGGARRGFALWIYVAVSLAALLVWAVASGNLAALWDAARDVFASPQSFREWTQSYGPWEMLVFFLAEAAQVILAPVPGDIFPPIGVAAFGPVTALALGMAGTEAGSAVVFLIARRWGRPLALRIVGEDKFERYMGIVSARGGLWLFLVFLLPLLPDDAVCALAGASALTFRRFMLVTALGRLPGTVLATYLSANLLTVPMSVWIVAVVPAALVALGLSLRYGDRVESWLLKRANGGEGEVR